MCQARVVLLDGDEEKEPMKEVVKVVPGGAGMVLTDILGDTLEVDAHLAEVLMDPFTVVLKGN